MVKTNRLTPDAHKFSQVMNDLVNKFGKQVTHRLITETLDDEGRVTARTPSDTIVFGDLQYGTQLSLKLISAGFVKAGDALFYISSEDAGASAIVPDNSIIIEGTTAGTYNAWDVVEEIKTDQVDGFDIIRTFRCTRRTKETIT